MNGVTVPHLCLRHHHGKSRMPRVVTITDGAKSVGDNITHQFTHPLAPSRSPFNSHRNAASPKPVAVLHLRLRYRKSGMPRDITITDEPNLLAATSRIHTSAGAATIAVQLASKRDIAKALRGQPGEFGATRVLLSNTRASDVIAATAGISNSASSMSCLFLCGPLRRISVYARFYVQCCLVLWRGGCYGGPLQFPDEIQGQSNWKSSHSWLDSPVVYPDLVLVAVCGRDQCCLSVRFTCLLCVCTVLCSNCGESHRSHQHVRNDEVQVSLRERTFDMVMVKDDNMER